MTVAEREKIVQSLRLADLQNLLIIQREVNREVKLALEAKGLKV